MKFKHSTPFMMFVNPDTCAHISLTARSYQWYKCKPIPIEVHILCKTVGTLCVLNHPTNKTLGDKALTSLIRIRIRMGLLLLHRSATKLISVQPIQEDGAPGAAAIEGRCPLLTCEAYARIFM